MRCRDWTVAAEKYESGICVCVWKEFHEKIRKKARKDESGEESIFVWITMSIKIVNVPHISYANMEIDQSGCNRGTQGRLFNVLAIISWILGDAK